MKSKLTTNAKEAQTNPETKQPICLQHYGLGLLLLSLTQHVSFCNNRKYAIVCEALLGDNQNGFFFYKQLLFNEVNEHHFLVMHMNDCYPELAHHASNLKWLVLMHNSIANTHTKVLYSDKKKLIDTVRAANFARDTVCGQNYMQSNYNDIIMAIKDQQQLIAKLLKMAPHIEIDDIKSTQKRRTRQKEKIATIDQLKKIMAKIDIGKISKSEVYVDEDLVVLTGNIGDNSSFQCLSKIIFGDKSQYQNVRALLSYVIKSIASFKLEANHFDLSKESVKTFCKDAYNAIIRMESCFDNDSDETFLSNYLVVSDDFDTMLQNKR
jgi:hypothetical protein